MRLSTFVPRALAVGLILAAPACTPVRWPYDPGNVTYQLGNNFGEYQNYGGSAYYHDGLDILGGSPRALYAVAGGTVTHVTDVGGGNYNGIMIGSPVAGGSGWLYWHIESSTLAVSVGDVVEAGDYLGDIVFWATSLFHHVHFSRVRGTGGYPWAWYEAIGNPLDWLEPDGDNASPAFQAAGAGVDFLFCRNDTSTYLNPSSLNGQVDIIARISDKFGAGTTWDMAPSSINVRIDPSGGGAAVLDKNAHFFHGALGTDSLVMPTVYKDDATADSRGDYSSRVFFFVVTNTDGTLGITAADAPSSWDTTAVADGNYVVTVTAWDLAGNEVSESMTVTVNN
jgi:hypothetical protein